ncbi:hypothetical protein PG997_009895 [Apiospora hydei]|uniref:Rhodopsin domain-containing protein n=1 Tax=Apiospora hydei TaxID=1337664 RepID=A0ABR1VWK5_9PEZI
MAIPVYTREQGGVVAVAVVCTLVPLLVIGLRFWARQVVHRRFDASDTWILVAHVMKVVFEGGLGLPEDIVEATYGRDAGIAHAKAGYASLIGGVSAAYLCKTSILSLYRRVFTLPGERLPFYAVGALTLLCGLSTLVGYFAVVPIAKQLVPRPHFTDAEKMRNDGFQLYTGIATCFTDVMILCFPLGKLYRLRMDRRRKIGLMATFMVGFITCIVAIIRTVATYVNLSNSATVQTLFRGLEPTVGIIAACLPLLHPLLRCSSRDEGVDRFTQKPPRRGQQQQQQPGAGIRKTVKVTVTLSRNGGQTTLGGWRSSNSSQEPLGAGGGGASGVARGDGVGGLWWSSAGGERAVAGWESCFYCDMIMYTIGRLKKRLPS